MKTSVIEAIRVVLKDRMIYGDIGSRKVIERVLDRAGRELLIARRERQLLHDLLSKLHSDFDPESDDLREATDAAIARFEALCSRVGGL